ncbi:MAG: serine hydroxymethyltransferase [Arsenophonus sp.]|nr:MAG: serine hydroxymethyltransferase [Arsenophonus sp.]
MFKNKNEKIEKYDFELWNSIQHEKNRQEQYINLIASENYVSKYVRKAQGSILTNKYAEGYPEKRYYAGCEYIDIIENLAIERAKKIFNSDFANVQPHSGTQANLAVYFALLKPGDYVLSMDLKHGGHLSHGSKSNFSGKLYNFIHYTLNNHGDIDYEDISYKAKKYKPKMIIAGFSSYSGIINWKKIRIIADQVNAYFLADIAHIAGLIVSGLYPSPIDYAHVVTTTTHKTLCGPRGGVILAKNGNQDFYKKLDSAVFPGIQGGPLMHVIAAKAIAFQESMTIDFKKYQKKVIQNAQSMVKVFLNRNYNIVSGGTKNHLFLVDLRNKNITGKEAEFILKKVNIVTNKNFVPNDKKSSFITSGIRIGTPTISKRGFSKCDSQRVASWICDILDNIKNKNLLSSIKKKVLNICNKYPFKN